MNLYMPQIYWHDRQGILSIDILQHNEFIENGSLKSIKPLTSKNFGVYKVATASVQTEIRIWEFYFEQVKPNDYDKEIHQLSVDFLANLSGHKATTNIVRFSPNGKFLASGDVHGELRIFKKLPRNDTAAPIPFQKNDFKEKNKLNDEFPPNKENWINAFPAPISHAGDVICIAWSPDSTLIASSSMDNRISVHKADTGKQLWIIEDFRHVACGITWDPRGKYLVTVSTDRRLDVLDARKGTKLRCCYKVELPQFNVGENQVVQEDYKIFHDDQLHCFMRGIEFSPCGSFIFAPAGHLEIENQNIYGTYIFKRSELDKCRPFAIIPWLKPTFMIKCSPVFYELRDDVKENFLQLPYRLVFAILCKEAVVLYDSQFSKLFAYIDNFQFDQLTSISWSPDGKVLVVSSLEGYNSFISFDDNVIGKPFENQNFAKLLNSKTEINEEKQPIALEYPDSPKLIKGNKVTKSKKETIVAVDTDKLEVSTIIVKRKKRSNENTPTAASPLTIKRRKDSNVVLKTPNSEKKETEKVVQAKIVDMWKK